MVRTFARRKERPVSRGDRRTEASAARARVPREHPHPPTIHCPLRKVNTELFRGPRLLQPSTTHEALQAQKWSISRLGTSARPRRPRGCGWRPAAARKHARSPALRPGSFTGALGSELSSASDLPRAPSTELSTRCLRSVRRCMAIGTLLRVRRREPSCSTPGRNRAVPPAPI